VNSGRSTFRSPEFSVLVVVDILRIFSWPLLMVGIATMAMSNAQTQPQPLSISFSFLSL
jgi:hypothetical protein